MGAVLLLSALAGAAALGAEKPSAGGPLLTRRLREWNAVDFGAWASRHGHSYSSTEERRHRQRVFEDNRKLIEAHNSKRGQSFVLALNEHADLSQEEFAARFTGLRLPEAVLRAKQLRGGARVLAAGTKSRSRSSTQSLSLSATPSATPTRSRTRSATSTKTLTASSTASRTPTRTARASPTPTASTTRSRSPTGTDSPSPTSTGSDTPSPSSTGTDTPSRSPAPLAGMDWAAAGRVSAARNQASCGSCYAFASVAAVESAVAIKSDASPLRLSEQQVVDCSNSDRYSQWQNFGCDGGWTDSAFDYLLEAGACAGEDYPYTDNAGVCRAHLCTPAAHISDYTVLPYRRRSAMESALQQQPLAVAITAGAASFRFYSAGILDDERCAAGSNNEVDHAVLLVGYGETASGQKFWKLKNSWGPEFGEHGYMRVARGAAYDGDGLCMLQVYASYPIAA